MTALERLAGLWFALLNSSSLAAAALSARASTRRRLSATTETGDELVLYREDDVGGTALGRVVLGDPGAPGRASRLLRRSRVMLHLDPRNFVFRSIDLPSRATDFIEPIVRTQIDKLTPWRAEQVLFGWSQPVPRADGAVAVTVAATDRGFVMPLMVRVQSLGTAEIVARVVLPRALDAPATEGGQSLVIARTSSAALSAGFWRKVIGGLTATVVVLVIASSLYAQVATTVLNGDAEELDRQGAVKRALVAKAIEGGGDPIAGPRQYVLQRKNDVPFATLVLDAVSRLLPDNSYVTTLEIDGTRLQIVGFTTDAPALIRLFEQSALFTGASFFAPTTRLPEDSADRFSIQATIKPGAFPR